MSLSAGLNAPMTSRALEVAGWPLWGLLTACPARTSLQWAWQGLAAQEDSWTFLRREHQAGVPGMLRGPGWGGQPSDRVLSMGLLGGHCCGLLSPDRSLGPEFWEGGGWQAEQVWQPREAPELAQGRWPATCPAVYQGMA